MEGGGKNMTLATSCLQHPSCGGKKEEGRRRTRLYALPNWLFTKKREGELFTRYSTPRIQDHGGGKVKKRKEKAVKGKIDVLHQGWE